MVDTSCILPLAVIIVVIGLAVVWAVNAVETGQVPPDVVKKL